MTHLQIVEVEDRPTHLYRHFDSTGRLLYVGISYNVMKRMKDHSKASHWFTEVSRIEVDLFPCRADAEIAEYRAIKAERPMYNDKHNDLPHTQECYAGITDLLFHDFVEYNLKRTYDPSSAGALSGVHYCDLMDDIQDGKISTVEGHKGYWELSGWQVLKMYCKRQKLLTELRR